MKKMAYSDKDMERLRNYEVVFDETCKLVDQQLKTSQTYCEYIFRFSDILEHFSGSTEIHEKFIGWTALNCVFPNLVYFLFVCDTELHCTRNLFCNLVMVMMDIAKIHQLKISHGILDEIELVLLPSLGDKTVKHADCLEHDNVQKIIDDWNTIKNPVKFIRKYAHKFEVEFKQDGCDWNDIYGFCLAIFLYLTLNIPNDMIFVERNMEYMLLGIIIKFCNYPLRIHPHFVKLLQKKLKLLRSYQI